MIRPLALDELHAMTVLHRPISPSASAAAAATATTSSDIPPSCTCQCGYRTITSQEEGGMSPTTGGGGGRRRRRRNLLLRPTPSFSPSSGLYRCCRWAAVISACICSGLIGGPPELGLPYFAVDAFSTHGATPKVGTMRGTMAHHRPDLESCSRPRDRRRRPSSFRGPLSSSSGLFQRTADRKLPRGDALKTRMVRLGDERDDRHVHHTGGAACPNGRGANLTSSSPSDVKRFPATGGDIPAPAHSKLPPHRLRQHRGGNLGLLGRMSTLVSGDGGSDEDDGEEEREGGGVVAEQPRSSRGRKIVPLLPNVRVVDSPPARIVGLLLIGGIVASLAMEGMPGVGGGGGGPDGAAPRGVGPPSPVQRFHPQRFVENMLDPQPLLEGIANNIAIGGDGGGDGFGVAEVEEDGAGDLAGAVLEDAGRAAEMVGAPAKGIARKVIGVAVPTSATDAAAVAVGEGIAGVLSAAGVAVLRVAMDAEMNRRRGISRRRPGGGDGGVGGRGQRVEEDVGDGGRGGDSSSASESKAAADDSTTRGTTFTTNAAGEGDDGVRSTGDGRGGGYGIVTEAVADGDYFLTRAAALPLLTEGLGVPLEAASIVSVLWALVPYELIKWSARVRQGKYFSSSSVGGRDEVDGTVSLQVLGDGGSDRSGDAEEKVKNIDFIELFADITKWLEYDVLMKDFGGKTVLSTAATGGGAFGAVTYPILDHHVLALPPFVSPSGLESAAFGFLAALSSQFYADVLNRYTPYGSDAARGEVGTRSLLGWADLYASKSLQAAALFGVYESAKGPISHAIVAFLTSGVDQCVGSSDFAFCMETYMVENPPEASPEAQFRAFVTATLGLFERFGFFGGSVDALSIETSSAGGVTAMYWDGINSALGPENVRALAVSFYSLLNRIPLVENFSFY